MSGTSRTESGGEPSRRSSATRRASPRSRTSISAGPDGGAGFGRSGRSSAHCVRSRVGGPVPGPWRVTPMRARAARGVLREPGGDFGPRPAAVVGQYRGPAAGPPPAGRSRTPGPAARHPGSGSRGRTYSPARIAPTGEPRASARGSGRDQPGAPTRSLTLGVRLYSPLWARCRFMSRWMRRRTRYSSSSSHRRPAGPRAKSSLTTASTVSSTRFRWNRE